MLEKAFSIISIYLILVVICIAQENQNDKKLLPMPVCLDGKTVYINKYGSVVLKTPFDYFRFQQNSFSEGLAGFNESGKYGFIDETGKVVIKPSFDYVDTFSEGFARIEINDKAGFIDKTAKMIVQPQYDKAWYFRDGFALAGIQNGSDENGFKKYKWGFIDKTGKIAIGKTKNEYTGKFDDADDFSEGLAPVKIGKKWGYVNDNDQIIIKLQFKEAKSFSEGLAPATIDGKKWGFIDKTGKFAIEPQFTDAEGFSEGLAAISTYKNGWGDWGFIDKTGSIVIRPTFFNVGKFHEDKVMLAFGSQGFGYADRTGKVIIKLQLSGASNFENGLAWVIPNDYGEKYILYGGAYIDKTGKYIWNAKEKNTLYGSNCNN